jgi:hypothetical protein
MACWWYLILLTIVLIHAQNSFDGGAFLTDPFLELTAGITTPVNQKTNRTNSTCISNGTLAGSIIATLLLSCLIAFLTWMVYLRQKLQGLFLSLLTIFFYIGDIRTSIVSESMEKPSTNISRKSS